MLGNMIELKSPTANAQVAAKTPAPWLTARQSTAATKALMLRPDGAHASQQSAPGESPHHRPRPVKEADELPGSFVRGIQHIPPM